jgi:hypothetical protein
MDWKNNLKLTKIAEKLSPKSRETETAEEIQAARELQQAEGSDSFFDAPSRQEKLEVKEKAKAKEEFVPMAPKKKFTEVCPHSLFAKSHNTSLSYSTNTLQQPSKYHTESSICLVAKYRGSR